MILRLLSNAPGATRLTIVDDGATQTGYDLLAGSSFGSPVWQHTFSGERGTQGARASQGKLPNREVSLVIRVAGSSKDNLAAKLSALAEVVDEMRRYGGTCRWKSRSQTRYQTAEVITASSELPTWDNRLEQINRGLVNVRLTCGPYMLGDPMDVDDDFSTDNVNGGDANYTADAGALANVAVTGGVLDASANLTTENRLIFTGNGYTLGDHEATVQATPGSTISSFKAGVILKRLDASNYLAVYVDDNGTNSRLRIDKVVAGSTTNLASTNLGARVANGQRLWIRGRIEGNVVYAEHFLYSNQPTPVASPTTSTSNPLDTATAAILGIDVEGRAGIVFTPQQTAAFLDDFQVRPFTYRNPPTYAIECFGAIPGDAPALGSARMGVPSGLTSAAFGLFGWAGRTGTFNYLPQFPSWVATAVAGVTGAATSVTAIFDSTLGAPARYGRTLYQVVTPATANTGASVPMYHRFRRGMPYTGTVWVRASAGTTNVRMRLGVSGDISSSTAVALSTTWTQHSVTWTPTADVDVAYIAVEVTAATATTFQFDGAAVYRGTVAPSDRQLQGLGSPPPLYIHPAESGEVATAGLTRTSDATANGGFAMNDTSAAAGGDGYSMRYAVDTGLMPVDDYSMDGIAVEVWARVKISAAFTGGVTIVTYASRSGDSRKDIHASEFGTAGRVLVNPSSGNDKWRMTRLGTLNLRHTPGGAVWMVHLEVTIAAGTNLQAFAIDDVWIIPIRSRALSPTDKTNADGSTYPSFLPDSGRQVRTIAPDLSSTLLLTPTNGDVYTEDSAGGICGSLIELPPGQISVVGMASSLVPDDPVTATASETQGATSLHVAVTPRWHWLRGA